LADVMVRTREEGEHDPDIRRLIGPPIWLRAGNFGAIGTVVADRRILDTSAVPTQYRDVAWELVCQAEHDVHDALVWALVRGSGSDTNPFVPLLQLHEAGALPLGGGADGLEVFVLSR
jgi:hypothetical protein